MKKIFFLFLFLDLCSFNSFAQDRIATQNHLEVERGVWGLKYYKNKGLINEEILERLYKTSPAAQKEYDRAKRLRLTAPILGALGTYMVYKGIRGTDYIGWDNVNKVEKQYVRTNVFVSLSGLLVGAVGICALEYSKDAQIKATEIYNLPRRISYRTGVLENGQIGFQVYF